MAPSKHIGIAAVSAEGAALCYRTAEEVAAVASARGFGRLGILGTGYLMEGPVYASKLSGHGIEFEIPDAKDRGDMDRIIFSELVYGRQKAVLGSAFKRSFEGLASGAATRWCSGAPRFRSSSRKTTRRCRRSTRRGFWLEPRFGKRRGTNNQSNQSWSDMAAMQTQPTPVTLRLWPAAVAVVLQWVATFGVPVLFPEAAVLSVLAGIAGGLVVLLWWLFFSRAPWSDRVGAILVMVVGLLAASRLVHPSIAGGMMGMMLPIMGIPVLGTALVIAVVATSRRSSGARRVSMVAAILLTCGMFTLLRTGGITGDAVSDLHWRWTPTPEERLLARASEEPVDSAGGEPATPAAAAPAPAMVPTEEHASTPAADLPAAPTVDAGTAKAPEKGEADSAAVNTGADWPGFRGPERDGVVRGVRIETDWAQSKPVELWRRPIGPGWSSFAVHGTVLYTQEQRGEDEIVSSYNLKTGVPVWKHSDAVRFYESNGGPGPRGTPAVSNGRVYAFGATGIVNALDARTGAVVWSHNAASDTGATLPGWGFSSSPLVVGDAVIVAASGRLVAYDAATGARRWSAPARGGSYSSPHRATIDGVEQILLLTGGGVISVAPADGSLLWEYKWEGGNIVQPALTSEGDVILGPIDATAAGVGTRRIAVAHGSGGWTVNERWTSTGLKPSFNDFVVHKGHAFGFDGSILASINLQDGKRDWKGGRYGHGQLVLLPDQDLLIVLSEDGELALVKATPDQFTELARVPAIEGKTWNHPVLVGDVLLVRNGEEMAAFRLSLAGR